MGCDSSEAEVKELGMIEKSHEEVRERAYEIWEREGRPDGQHESHWRQALAELALMDPADVQNDNKKTKPRKKTAIAAE
jgi:hypothetical protein